MEDSTELQILPTAAENGQHEIQREPESESNPSSPWSTPALGVAEPAPARVHVKKPYPGRGYFDVRDASAVETVMMVLGIIMVIADLVFFVSSFLVTGQQYMTSYSWLLTASNILRLFDKWYRVQGGFDSFISLLGDFEPGVYALIIGLWGSDWKVLLAVNVFSLCFGFINTTIQWFPSYITIPIKGNVKKFLRAKQFRDRYEDIGISGLLPCNEATNKIKESRVKFDDYYTLGKVDHETLVSDEETDSDEEIDGNDIETPAETLASLRAQKKLRWIIGTMMVSYSDNDDWVTIKQKAEERAVKIFMEHFTPQQKLNFIEMMEAWKKRPSQGILKKIGRRRSHCFTLVRLIDLTKQGFSVYSEKMKEPRTIKVGAEEDAGVEDFIDSIWKVLEVVYSRVARQMAIIVAIVAVFMMFNWSTVYENEFTPGWGSQSGVHVFRFR